MPRVRVESFTISLDGYGAGPNQNLANPPGVGGAELHQWMFATRMIQHTQFGTDGGTTFHFVTGGIYEAFGYTCVDVVASDKTTHVVLRREKATGGTSESGAV